ncbi:MAG TPA: basic amino acid ABC transporter substrate-binding protein [Symbiobacteriaceae bacterium]|nr:basic amino acid ABC transporter substrate-binding protein [Symbiobacteriaceae bacterium]
MQKALSALLAVALAFALTACGAKQNNQTTAGNHLAAIKQKGTIVLGTSADYPPYEFHKTEGGQDKIVGWEIELAEQIAKDLGVKLEIRDIPFDNLIPELQAGKVDFVVSALTITEKRAKSVDFTDPYWRGGQVILAAADKAGAITTAADLKGRRVAVQLGSTGEAEAQKVQGAQLVQLDKFEAAVMEVLSGKADAVIAGYTVAKNYEKNNPKLKIAGPPLSTEDNGIAVKKGDKELLAAIGSSLAKLKGAPLDAMVKKYEAVEAK